MQYLYLEFALPGRHYRESPARLKPCSQLFLKALVKQGERMGCSKRHPLMGYAI